MSISYDSEHLLFFPLNFFQDFYIEHSAECTVRLLNQAGRNNYPCDPEFVVNAGNRTRNLWLEKFISKQQL